MLMLYMRTYLTWIVTDINEIPSLINHMVVFLHLQHPEADGEGTRDGARKQGPITRNSFWSNYWNWGQFTNVKIHVNLWTPLIIKYSYIIAISMRFLCTIWPRQSNYCQVNRGRLVAKRFAAGCACNCPINTYLEDLQALIPLALILQYSTVQIL